MTWMSALRRCRAFLLRRVLWLALAVAWCGFAAIPYVFPATRFCARLLVLPQLEARTWDWAVHCARIKGNLRLLLDDFHAAETSPWAF